MPMGVTKKQERQYEHIKESYQPTRRRSVRRAP